MASTMKKQDGATDMAVGTAVMTDKCLADLLAGNVKSSNTFKLVLLDLANQGTLTLTPSGVNFWSDLSAAETNTKSDGSATPAGYTKGTGIALAGNSIPAVSAHMEALDFSDISLDNADLRTDAYAIVRWVTSTADSPVLGMGKFSGVKTPAGTGTANFTIPVASPIRITAADAA